MTFTFQIVLTAAPVELWIVFACFFRVSFFRVFFSRVFFRRKTPKYDRTLYEQHTLFAAPRFPSRNAPPIAIEKQVQNMNSNGTSSGLKCKSQLWRMVPKQVQNMNEFYVSSTRFFASPPCVHPHTIDKTRPKYERILYEQHTFFEAVGNLRIGGRIDRSIDRFRIDRFRMDRSISIDWSRSIGRVLSPRTVPPLTINQKTPKYERFLKRKHTFFYRTEERYAAPRIPR